MCNYKCKKKKHFKKIKSKHIDHKYSTCDLNFKTFNKVTTHKVQHYSLTKREMENVETSKNNLKDSEKYFKETSFVYSEWQKKPSVNFIYI